jgi:hypothetical protein
MSRDQRRAEQRRAYHVTVAAVLKAAQPGLQDDDISNLLEKARVSKGIPLRQLAGHMADHPDALTSGDPRCPSAHIRLVHVLHDAGLSVVRPGCATCGKVIVDPSRSGFGPDGRICPMCEVRARLGVCARCGRENTRIAARRTEGRICYHCYRVDPEVVEECGRCGRTRMPASRLDDGTPLCLGCQTRPNRRCDLCGQDKPAAISNNDEVVCRSCYQHHRQRRALCGGCGRIRPIAKRAVDGEPDLCYSCNVGPDMVCAGCGRTRPCRRRGADAVWLCGSCAPKTVVDCAQCGRSRHIRARWPLGPLCAGCYTTMVNAPRECASCGEVHVLVARDQHGASVCGPCVGVDLDPHCATCGRPGGHYGPGKCAHCVLADRLHDLLAGPDGNVSAQLQPVHRALASVQDARSQIRWSMHSPNAKLLAQLAATGEPLSHSQLDALPPGRHEYYVRQLLVSTGVLPERDDDLERLPAWLDKTLANKPAEHARLIRPFTHWFLLRRARRRAAARRQPAVANSYLRTRIVTALRLLAWLDDRGVALADFDQAALDSWLANGNVSNYNIRYFLDWAGDRGLVRKLIVPSRPRQAPERILDEQERWSLLRRCLADETLALDTRTASALLLLFGLQITRIRHLTIDQLEIDDTRSLLWTGRHPLLLPPRLAALLKQLAAAPHTRARLTKAGNPPRWLFPGLTPGRPITQTGFKVKLRALGIDARAARSAALISLAGDLPTAVLADVLGMHTLTAERWAALAKRDWAAYIAERAVELSSNERNLPNDRTGK